MKYQYLFVSMVVAFLLSTTIQGQDLDLGTDTSYCTNSSITLMSNLMDITYTYLWSTGDTTSSIDIDTTGLYWLEITYDTMIIMEPDTMLDTIHIVDSIQITILATPISMILPIDNCYPNPALIINNSVFEIGSSITYTIGLDTIGPDTIQIPPDTIQYNNLLNGQSVEVFSSIVQPNGCLALDTFSISSLLKPSIHLSVDSTCKNISPIIQNQSTNTTASYSVSISETSTWNFMGMSTFQLPLQSSGSHNYNCILTNDNTCSDTMSLPLYIFDILPREILGLEPDYCIGDTPDIIKGNFAGGNFVGPYTMDLPPGQAIFNPNTVDSNIVITYTYTDSNSCTLSTSDTVGHVYPLPQLEIGGLEVEYCKLDPASMITVTPAGGNLSGSGLTDISGDGAVFTPNMVGSQILFYSYTDTNMCSNSITAMTIVNPLPDVELGPPDTLIGIGETLILGPEFTEPNVSYSWSTGHMGNSLAVTNPGYYILYGTNSITGCQSSDTIRVELLNKTNEADIFSKIKIYPIPFSSELTLEGTVSPYLIKVYDGLGRNIPINIQSSGDITRLGFDYETSSLLILQLSHTYSVPIFRIPAH